MTGVDTQLDQVSVDDLSRCPKCGVLASEPCVKSDGSYAHRKHVASCGSYSGYQKHKRIGEASCGPCQDANREYSAQRRAEVPDVRHYDVTYNRRYRAAVSRLIDQHRLEFDSILDELKEASS